LNDVNAIADTFIEEAPMVYVGDLIDEAACQNILTEFAEEARWIQAQVTTYTETDNGQGSIKSIIDLDRRLARRIHFCDLDMQSKPHTHAALSVIKKEVATFVERELGFRTSDFGDEEIVRYPVGGKFVPHSDANKLKAYRALSIVLYLNDDYEGGKTSFPLLNYACSPKAGRVLVFNSQLLHAGDPVLSGEKFIIVLWAFYPGGK